MKKLKAKFLALLDSLWIRYGRRRGHLDKSNALIKVNPADFKNIAGAMAYRTNNAGELTVIMTANSLSLYNLKLTDAEIDEIFRMNGAVPARYQFGPLEKWKAKAP